MNESTLRNNSDMPDKLKEVLPVLLFFLQYYYEREGRASPPILPLRHDGRSGRKLSSKDFTH